MHILAVDTSTTSCSVSVTAADALLAEVTVVKKQSHSKHLMDMIHTVMGLAGMALADLDGFAVTLGPGTFTGLRIGISTVKGLAVATGRPVVGVSSLDALATQCAESRMLVCPLIDARKGEVYFSRLRPAAGGLVREGQEQTASPVQALGGIAEPSLFVGNGAQLYQQVIVDVLGKWAHFAQPGQHTIRAATVAQLGAKRFARSGGDPAAELVPQYIRQSDAELSFRRLE